MKGEMKTNQQNIISRQGTQFLQKLPIANISKKDAMCVVCVTFSFNISPWKK